MKINLEISDIDYGALVELLLPLIHNKLEGMDGFGAQILCKIADMPPDVAGKMVDYMPQSTKDDIAVYLINSKKNTIISSIKDYAAGKGLYFNIDEFSAEK